MTISTETIAKAFSTVAAQRKAAGELVYRAKVGDKWIGYNYRLVKTKRAAMTMFCDDPLVWARQVDRWQLGLELEQVASRVQMHVVK